MREKNERKFKGVWIKKEIWLHPKLTWLQKCVVAEIDSLSSDDEDCFASDLYLSKLFYVSKGRMANILSDLRKLGVIKSSDYDGKKRGLRVADHFTETVKGGLHGNREGDFTETVKGDFTETVNSLIKENKDENKAEDCAVAPIPKKDKRHSEFMRHWCEGHERIYGEKYSMTPQDARALKDFLKFVKLEASEIFSVAELAWEKKDKGDKRKFFKCGLSGSIQSFFKWFNDIKSELKQSGITSGPIRADRDWNKIFGTE